MTIKPFTEPVIMDGFEFKQYGDEESSYEMMFSLHSYLHSLVNILKEHPDNSLDSMYTLLNPAAAMSAVIINKMRKLSYKRRGEQ